MKKSIYIASACLCGPIACAGGDEIGLSASGMSAPQDHRGNSESSGDSGDAGNSGGSGESESSKDFGSSGATDEADVCGDGMIEGDTEVCDDGAENGDYGKCNENCTGIGPHCGDGAVSGPEACDDGDLDDSDDCTSQCVTTACGDGVVQPATEACDDGRNGDPDDSCTDTCSFPTCGDGFVQSSLGEACDDGNKVPEDGCESDCSPTTKWVFVTSQKLQGDFGGVLTADQFCQSAANFAGLAGTYMAWLSDGNLRPASRFVASVYPYTLIDGSVVADDFADLIDGVLDHAINMDELGLVAPEKTYVWTGLKADGYTYALSCSKWTATKEADDGQWPPPNSLNGYIGEAWQTTDDWSLLSVYPCVASLSLYCIEQ